MSGQEGLMMYRYSEKYHYGCPRSCPLIVGIFRDMIIFTCLFSEIQCSSEIAEPVP